MNRTDTASHPLRARIAAILCIATSIIPAKAHDHYGAGFVDTNNNAHADAGEPLGLIGPFYETVSVNNVQTLRQLQFTGPVGGPLRFVHIDDGTDRIFHLMARPFGQRPVQRCGGYYMLDERPRTLSSFDSFSFIALSDGQFDAASPSHAHTGAFIWMEIVNVSGPPGAHFGFWEENWSQFNDTPSVSFATNQPTGGYKFILSEGIDDVSEDPFGHIHGRSWTADKPGDYYVGLRLVDLSTSGPGGGSWHTPSQTYIYHFQAGPSFQPLGQLVSGTGYVLTWPSQMGVYAADASQTGIVFTIERRATLAAGSWSPLGTVTGTIANTATFTDPSPPAGNVFYRLKHSWSTP